MSSSYRMSRNLEASIIEYLETNLKADWRGVGIEKSFVKSYDVPLPVVCVRLGNTTHEWAEVGTTSTRRNALILLDVFTTSDGQRLDLKDYIIEKIKVGCPYYEYVTSNNRILSRTANGNIRVLSIEDKPLNFGSDKSELSAHDRFRHLITLDVSIGKVE